MVNGVGIEPTTTGLKVHRYPCFHMLPNFTVPL